MKKSLKVVCLTFMLVFVPLAQVMHAQPQSTDIQKTAKVKSDITKRVATNKTRVKLKLRNGEELKGRIDRADDNGFTVTEDKTGKQIQMSYTEVDGVKGRGLGSGAKIGIIAAVVVVVVVVVAVINVKNIDPFQGGITAR